ncbi:hypothetical protein RYX36_033330 [Vicia faba]
MPKRWRGKQSTETVRTEFETLFQYTGMMLLEEMASNFLTPYLLLFVVPKRVDDILQFIADFTVHVESVGHVCSFSVFDFQRHRNSSYGSSSDSPRDQRSSQGKLEKSFLSFQSSYPSWEPNAEGKKFLLNLRAFREQKSSSGHVNRQGFPPLILWRGSPRHTKPPSPFLPISNFIHLIHLLNRISDSVMATTSAGSSDPTANRPQTKRPKYSKFTQQELPACKPILTPQAVISAFLIVTIVFIPIGVASLIASRDVVEIVDRYEDACVPSNWTDKVAFIQSAILLALSLAWLKGFQIRSKFRKYTATFEFSQASGISTGTPVRIRGVIVGDVIRVNPSLTSIEAVVEIEDDKTILPCNSLVEVNQSGLLMETIIDITPRDPLFNPLFLAVDNPTPPPQLPALKAQHQRLNRNLPPISQLYNTQSTTSLFIFVARLAQEVQEASVFQGYILHHQNHRRLDGALVQLEARTRRIVHSFSHIYLIQDFQVCFSYFNFSLIVLDP